MYVIDGIAYAGEQQKPITVKSARPLNDHRVLVSFGNGERRVFDFAPLLDIPCYQPLKDKTVFDSVYVDCGTLCWNDGDIDIAPETVYERSALPENTEIG